MAVVGARSIENPYADDPVIYYLYYSGDLDRHASAVIALTGNNTDAHDVIQDIALERVVFLKSGSSDDPMQHYTPKRWVAQRIRTLCFNLNRSLKSRKANETTWTAVQPKDPAIHAIVKVQNTALLNAIQTLSQDQIEAIVLADFYGFSSAEIQQMTGVQAATVRQNVKRGKESLQQYRDQFVDLPKDKDLS